VPGGWEQPQGHCLPEGREQEGEIVGQRGRLRSCEGGCWGVSRGTCRGARRHGRWSGRGLGGPGHACAHGNRISSSGWRLAWSWRASLPGAQWVGAAARPLFARRPRAGGRDRRTEREAEELRGWVPGRFTWNMLRGTTARAVVRAGPWGPGHACAHGNRISSSGWRLAWPWRASLPGARWVGAAARPLFARRSRGRREGRRTAREAEELRKCVPGCRTWNVPTVGQWELTIAVSHDDHDIAATRRVMVH